MSHNVRSSPSVSGPSAGGEIRLPAQLDLGSCPSVRDCGRVADAELLHPGLHRHRHSGVGDGLFAARVSVMERDTMGQPVFPANCRIHCIMRITALSHS